MCRFHQHVIIDSRQPENAYGRFAHHILISEGLSGFSPVDLATADFPDLTEADLILVTRCYLRGAQVDRLCDAVRRGARAVFLQPQPLVIAQLGFAPASGVTYPAAVRPRNDHGEADPPLQTHLPIPSYEIPAGAHDWRILADTLDTQWRETGHPAVVTARVGCGQVTLFFYDVAEAVARIRFGNPDLGGYTANPTWNWPHALDLFADHLDPRAAHVPQADLQAQFLARALTDAAPCPLARLWYYEDAAHRTVGVFQSDGDWSEPEQFRALASALEKRGGAGTFYLMETTKLSEADVAALRARGHTFGPHVHPMARDEELYFAVPDALRAETEGFASRFGAVSPTLQCHCAPWPSYMATVPAHIENGYRLLFAYLPGSFELWGKYLCGSGRPMRFCDRDGAVYDCWQQPLVILDDESLIPFLRDRRDAALRAFDAALDAALERNHTAMPILSHPVSFCTYSSPVMEYAFDRLHESGVPVYNADTWLRFTDWRAGVRIAQAADEDGATVCDVSGVEGRIPVMFPVKRLGSDDPNVSVNGERAPFLRLRRFGEDFLFVQIDGGEHGRDVRIEIH